ncbi:MAG: hypothetical protein IKD69_11555 [Solobacterium sp.]|nr:hypothetical protein [Solobacterium sp.]
MCRSICGIVLLAAKALAILFDMNHRPVDIAFSAAIFFIGAVNLFFELHGSGSFRFLMAGLCLIMALLAGLDVFLKIRETGKSASLR